MKAVNWTRELDCVIVNGVRAGRSASQIAADLGPRFTRNMVIGRHKRIRGIVTDHERDLAARAVRDRARQKAARRRIVQEKLAEIDRQIARGFRRNYVIAGARLSGLTLGQIGKHFGICGERIRQICEDEGVPPMRAAA